MTCKDCIHYEPCFSGGVSMWNNIEQKKEDCCSHFKNKADFAEVVRCKDCKYAIFLYSCGKYMCKKGYGATKTESDFCSYGERRDT